MRGRSWARQAWLSGMSPLVSWWPAIRPASSGKSNRETACTGFLATTGGHGGPFRAGATPQAFLRTCMHAPPYKHLAALGVLLVTGLLFYWPSVYKVAYGVVHRQGRLARCLYTPIVGLFHLSRVGPAQSASRPFLDTRHHWPADSAILAVIGPNSFRARVCRLRAVCGALRSNGARKANIHCPSLPGFVHAHDEYRSRASCTRNWPDMTRQITFSASLIILSLLGHTLLQRGLADKAAQRRFGGGDQLQRDSLSYLLFRLRHRVCLFIPEKFSGPRAARRGHDTHIAGSQHLRLTIIFLATHFISPRMAEYWPHVILSWIVFFSILFGLIFIDQRRHDGPASRAMRNTAQPDA